MHYGTKDLRDALVEFDELPNGASLAKWVATDYAEGSDIGVELHGVLTPDGRVLILSERVTKKE